MSDADRQLVARGIIDANAYWVSRPDARDSRNLATRSTVAIVIFDSTVAEGEAQAIYIEAEAERVGDAEQAQAIEVVSHRSQARGGDQWTANDRRVPVRLDPED
jgi:hypothetical protein